ncbi:MAG: toll/interleukin-1 receptor domain-containing protein [Armatimonadota bacterium]
MAINVFISHSTWYPEAETDGHAAFREKVYARLEAAGFHPVLDRIIHPGQHWRQVLFDRLAECHAAVVLADEHALGSDWVDTEVKILCWRANVDQQDFRLLMVPYGGVTPARIAEKRGWAAIAPGEIQMLLRDKGGLHIDDPAAVADTLDVLVEELRKVPDYSIDTTSSGWLMGRICALLNFTRDCLAKIAGSLEIDPKPALTDAQLKRLIAVRMYDEGPSSIRAIVEQSGHHMGQGRALGPLVDILNTYWVDPTASVVLLKSCYLNAAPKPLPPFGLRCIKRGFTPMAYVTQICHCNPPWHIFKPAEKSFSAEDIVQQIRQELIDQCLPPEYDPSSDPTEIDQALNNLINDLLEEDRTPIFVTLTSEAAREGKVQAAISRAFPNLRIIYCFPHPPDTPEGIPPPPPVPMPDYVEPLLPEVNKDIESKAERAYNKAWSRI